MAKVLIAYATQYGQTRKIAARIADALAKSGHVVEVCDLKHEVPDELEQFALVVVGAPIQAGGYPRSVTRFLRKNRGVLERAPSAFFSVGLGVLSRISNGKAQTRELVAQLCKRTGFAPRRVELVAGAVAYSKYGPLTRLIMRRICAKEGGDDDTSRDYEYTDWAAVDRFAQELGEMLEPPTASVPLELGPPPRLVTVPRVAP